MTKKQWRGIIIPAVLFWRILSAPGFAADSRLLSGHRAGEHIGSLSELVSKGPYAVLELKRRTFHPRTQAEIDALVLFKGNNRFVVLRHKDSDHRLKINAPEGRSADILTADNLSFFAQKIKENDLRPHLVLDRDGNELFIVYCAFMPCLLSWRQAEKKAVLITIRESPRRILLPRLPLDSGLIRKK